MLAAVELRLDLNPRTATKNAAGWHLLLPTSSQLKESKHQKKLESTARNTQEETAETAPRHQTAPNQEHLRQQVQTDEGVLFVHNSLHPYCDVASTQPTYAASTESRSWLAEPKLRWKLRPASSPSKAHKQDNKLESTARNATRGVTAETAPPRQTARNLEHSPPPGYRWGHRCRQDPVSAGTAAFCSRK
jgi:hypothetical protein